jgi:hypothetical protein
MSLQVIAQTCDKYVHLMPGFFHQWQKYCGLTGIMVTETKVTKLPMGWSFIRAGHDHDGKGWAGNLLMALDQTVAESVLLVLDDYWLTTQADVVRIQQLAKWIEDDKSIDKIDLTKDRLGFANVSWNTQFVRSLPMAQYLTSTQAALWRASFLRRCLRDPGWNPWEFEIKGTHFAQKTPHKILGCRIPAIHYANVMLKGKMNQLELDKISKRDLKSIGAKSL